MAAPKRTWRTRKRLQNTESVAGTSQTLFTDMWDGWLNPYYIVTLLMIWKQFIPLLQNWSLLLRRALEQMGMQKRGEENKFGTD